MRSSAEGPAAAVVVAGGSGTRLGGAVRKQYLDLGGQPVLLRAVRAFVEHPGIATVVVVLPPDDAADPPGWLGALGVHIVPGGAERGDSVWNGLAALPEGIARVLVHDGARPLVTRDVIDRVLDACGDAGAIAAVPVVDTIKSVDGDRWITGTPDRAALWQAQTPQGFPRAALVDAYRRARADGALATDDAAIFERAGGRVRVVPGAPENLKVTRPGDLEIAEVLLRRLSTENGAG
jgi:2-C-methyl-D-erythritol 4-phosphate cytidylyltransferase